MPWGKETWIDDDGSLTVGTPYTAARMNNIELGIEEALRDISDIAFDAASQSAAATTNLQWEHTPSVAKPAGVVVITVQNGEAVDQVTSCRYGEVPMEEVPGSPFKGAEVKGMIHVFWLGRANVKRGPQEVLVVSSGTNSKRAVAYTVTSTSPTLTVQAGFGAAGKTEAKAMILIGAGVPLRTGSDAVMIGALLLGDPATTEFKINWGTQDFTHDFGSQVAGWGHLTPADTEENRTFVRWETLSASAVGFAHFTVAIRPVRDYGKQTELPTSAGFGDRLTFVADAENEVFWDLIYDGVGEFPWKFQGGPDLNKEVETAQTTTSKAFTGLTTAGPSLTLPLKGDYDIEVSCDCFGGAGNMFMSYKIGATAASNADGILVNAGGVTVQQPSRRQRKLGLAAATVILTQYASETGTEFTFGRRRLSVTPVRVG